MDGIDNTNECTTGSGRIVVESQRMDSDIRDLRPQLNEAEAEFPIPDMMRDIVIEPLKRGFTVRVGCSSFAVETKKNLIEYLTRYINDPRTTEKQWFDGTLFPNE
jgi:hypothetical protein